MLYRLLLAAALAVGVAGTANAMHERPMFSFYEGKTTEIGRGSFCKSEDAAVAVIQTLETEDMQASIAIYNEFVLIGECRTIQSPFPFIPARLVYQFGDAVAIEVTNKAGDESIYLISPNAEFVPKGETLSIPGDDA